MLQGSGRRRLVGRKARTIEHYPQELDRYAMEIPGVQLFKRKRKVIVRRPLQMRDLSKSQLYYFHVLGFAEYGEEAAAGSGNSSAASGRQHREVVRQTIEGDVRPTSGGGYQVVFNNITQGVVDFLKPPMRMDKGGFAK